MRTISKPTDEQLQRLMNLIALPATLDEEGIYDRFGCYGWAYFTQDYCKWLEKNYPDLYDRAKTDNNITPIECQFWWRDDNEDSTGYEAFKKNAEYIYTHKKALELVCQELQEFLDNFEEYKEESEWDESDERWDEDFIPFDSEEEYRSELNTLFKDVQFDSDTQSSANLPIDPLTGLVDDVSGTWMEDSPFMKDLEKMKAENPDKFNQVFNDLAKTLLPNSHLAKKLAKGLQPNEELPSPESTIINFNAPDAKPGRKAPEIDDYEFTKKVLDLVKFNTNDLPTASQFTRSNRMIGIPKSLLRDFKTKIEDAFVRQNPALKKVYADISKVDVSCENTEGSWVICVDVAIDDFGYITMMCGSGERNHSTTLPVVFFIYWDGSDWRAFVPVKGNAINMKTRKPIALDVRCHIDTVEDKQYLEGMGFDWEQSFKDWTPEWDVLRGQLYKRIIVENEE